MTDQEFGLPFFLRDARYVVGGVITQKAKIQSLSWFTGKADVSAAVNVQKTVNEKRYHWWLNTHPLIEKIAFCAVIALVHVHPTLFRLLESR